MGVLELSTSSLYDIISTDTNPIFHKWNSNVTMHWYLIVASYNIILYLKDLLEYDF